MKCLISKIIIDYREESGKTLPGMVRAHLKNCRDCRAYMNLGKQLKETEYDTSITNSSIHKLNTKIFSNLENQSKEKFNSAFTASLSFCSWQQYAGTNAYP